MKDLHYSPSISRRHFIKRTSATGALTGLTIMSELRAQSPNNKLNIEFVGSKATLSGFWKFAVSEGEADLSPTRDDEPHLAQSDNHSSNWLECIASRRRPVMDVEIGHRATCWSHLANIAYLLGRKVQWDPAAERFIGDEQANRMLRRAYRGLWRI